MKKEQVELNIHKDIILKNYMKYSPDKGLIVAVLNNVKEDSISKSELLEMIKTENERVIE